ncbi:LamG-like jellyroll fold domain-containing protein [Plantactinospora sp. BB1]|uniref:LamG-like jellyroll fold domain-containing protein n=1 Tax=Plantactinospora sp. BB1 TaxID=2071627 RepID=UPI00272A4384|nr:LamG-like jellyroll fold domain-containing protein [Plantactinospora sp. BB1]
MLLAIGAAPALAQPSASAQPQCASEAVSEAQAVAAAEACDGPVVVGSSRSEFARVVAQPGGELTFESGVVPLWARRADGSWADVDLRLSRGGDGRLRPAVSVADVTFSNGGMNPLVSLTREGRTFTVGWPAALPAPSVSGDTATYAEVLPGVDLTVQATRTGFSHLLVVKTVQAAANPAVRQIHFDLGGDARAAGLPDGSLRAQVGAEVVASAEPAVMWNSAGQTAAMGRVSAVGESTVEGPAGGAATAPVRTAVTAEGDLVLTPDAEMLAGAPEEFPVFIDPAWSVRQSRWAYATDDNCSNADYTVARMGYSPEGPCIGSVFRSFFQFPTTSNGVSLAGKHIADAYVQMKLTHSHSCDDTWAYMYQTPVIDHAMKATWSKMTLGTLLDGTGGHANEAGGCGVLQPDMIMNFDSSVVTTKVQAVADHRATLWTVGFSARDSNGANEGTLERWKKFVPADAKLIVEYNSKPSKPTSLHVAGVACPASGAVGIGTLTPTFSAVYPDADNTQSLTGTYEWIEVPAGGIGLVTDSFPSRLPRPATASAPAGGRATTVSVTGLTTAKTYAFRVTSVDPYEQWSGWSAWCQFTVDNHGPPAPVITPPDDEEVDGPGTPVTFQVKVSGDNTADVTKFRYSWTGDPAGTARVRTHPGTGTGGLAETWSEPALGWQVDGSTVFSPGDLSGDGKPDVVFRRVTDRSLQLVRGNGAGGFITAPQTLDSGNWSTAQYLFSPGDFSGDGRPDLLYRNAGDLHLYMRRGTATGGLETTAVQVGVGWSAANWIFSPGDFSGDGKPDVLYRSSANAALYMVRGNGTGGWVTGRSEPIGNSWGALELLTGRGDFSGDGKPDLLYRHKSDNSLRMTRGNGTGGWVTGMSELLAPSWADVAGLVTPGDFTGDGKRDVLAVLPTANFGEVPASGTTEKTAPITVMVPGYGTNTLWVRAIDSTGNLGHLASWDLKTVQPASPTALWDLETHPGRSQAQALKDLRPGADDDGPTDLTASNVTWRTDARLIGGQTAAFNGTSSYLSAQADALDTSDSFSVAAWVNLADKSTDRTVLAKDANGNESLRLMYQQSSDRWLVRIPSAATGTVTWSEARSTTAPATGVWTHLAVAYDKTAGTLILYVNGMVEDRLDGVATFNDAGHQMWVGRSKTTWWKGDIVDVQVFDRTLIEHDFTGQLWTDPTSGGVSHPGVLTPTKAGDWNFTNAVPCWEPVIEPGVCEAVDRSRFGRRFALSHGVNVGQGQRGLGLALNGTWDLDPNDPRHDELTTTEYGWSQTNNGTPEAPIWQDGTVLRTDDSYTVSVWAYRDEEAGEQTLVSQRGNSESAFSVKYQPDGDGDGGEWQFIVNDEDTSASLQASVKSPASEDGSGWVHLVGVYDAARGQIRLYVQGQLAETALLSWTPMASSGPLQLGRALSNGSLSEYWHGGVDDLLVYQGAMTDAQVDALYDEQSVDMTVF